MPQPLTQPVAAPAAAPALSPAITAEPFASLPPGWVVRAALWLRRRLQTLASTVGPPELRIFELATGAIATQLLGVVARHNIADALADGPRSAAELAAATGLDADALHRVLRALAYLGVFTIDSAGRVANNRYSEALRAGNLAHVRESAIYFSSGSNMRAWLDLEETVRTGGNAFERVHGTSVWDWFDRHPDEREVFAQMMTGGTIATAPAIATLYPWGEVQRVCDVGGGRGTLLSELLVRHPHLTGMLCDGAGVLEAARVLCAQRGVSDRVQLVPGSFFDEVPGGADAYVLKNILHDWDDVRSLRILGVVRRAMQPGQRLLICETLTERNDTDGFGALADVQMMVVCGDGRERGRDEYARLLTDSGFRPGRVLPGPMMSVLEGIAQ
jgi:O-methyltransferase